MNNFFKKKIKIIKQKRIIHPLGNIIKIISKNNESYAGFSETYFSEIKKNSIKAWKYHKKMTIIQLESALMKLKEYKKTLKQTNYLKSQLPCYSVLQVESEDEDNEDKKIDEDE